MTQIDNQDTTSIDEPFGGLIINGYGIYDKSDQKHLEEYISDQVAKARIDEIKRMREGMTFAHMTPSIYASERIQTILSEKDTGVGIQTIISEDK